MSSQMPRDRSRPEPGGKLAGIVQTLGRTGVGTHLERFTNGLRTVSILWVPGVEPAQPAKPPVVAKSLGAPPFGLRPQPPDSSVRAQSNREAL
jgi:hypothetical protein